MKKALEVIKNFCKEEDGVVAMEYGLVAALVVVGVITAFAFFSGGISSIMNSVNDALNTVGTNATTKAN